jgi:hypothetical protein
MLPHLFYRPEPALDAQPYALDHLRDMGRTVPRRLLSNDAYGALLTIAASRTVTVDAYTHGDPRPGHGGEWVIECHGTYGWQEPRWTPEQWQAFFEVFLKNLYKEGSLVDGRAWLQICTAFALNHPNGQLARVVDHVVQATRRARGDGGAA